MRPRRRSTKLWFLEERIIRELYETCTRAERSKKGCEEEWNMPSWTTYTTQLNMERDG
jgi:hypothetical protein